MVATRNGVLPQTEQAARQSRTAEIVARDHAVMSPSLTRPYPLAVARGRGCWVEDVEGRRFLDFTAGIAVLTTGHAHPRVVRAVQQQAAQFIHMAGTDFYYAAQVELAERLAAHSPTGPGSRVFFTNSGTESVDVALKLARWRTGRPYVLAFLGGFHGRTMGALAATASKAVQRQGFFTGMSGVMHLPYPQEERPESLAATFAAMDAVFRHLAAPEEIAAVIVEPVQGEGGIVVPPAEFLAELRRRTERHGILLVADEVQTGFGRTGAWFAVEHDGVAPDILCAAKGIASGMPMGAVIAAEGVMTWGPGSQGNTYGGNPVACAAALATLDLLEEGLVERARVEGERLRKRAERLARRAPAIGRVRGKGLMQGLVIHDPATGEPAPALRDRIVTAAFNRGLLLLPAGRDTIRLTPPLVAGPREIAEALRRLEAALAAESNVRPAQRRGRASAEMVYAES